MAKGVSGSERLDFDAMSDEELRDTVRHATEALRTRITERLEEYRSLAREVGIDLTLAKSGEGEGRRGRRRSIEPPEGEDRRREVTAKYRNPDNPAETWSGRGKPPRWMDERLKTGAKKEDFLIGERAKEQAA